MLRVSVLCCVSAVCAAGQQVSFDEHMRRGAAQQRAGDLQGAAAEYGLAAKASPRFAPAPMNQGIALYAARRYAEALIPLDKALELDSRLGPAWLFGGLSYFQLRRFPDAVRYLERAEVSMPKDAQAALFLGQALVEVNRAPEGIRYLEKAEELNPKNMEVLFALSQAYWKRAIAIQETMLETDPHHPRSYQLLGQLYEQENDLDAARAEYAEMLKSAPDNPGSHGLAAALEYRAGNLEKARREYEAEAANSPGDAGNWARLGHVCLELQDAAAAKSALGRALELDDALLDAQLDQAALWIGEDRGADAVKMLERSVKQAPDDKRCHFLLAKALRKTGNPERARLELDRFTELNRENESASSRNRSLMDVLKRNTGEGRPAPGVR